MDQLWYEDNQREGEEDLKYEEPQVEFVEATYSVVQKIPLGITKCRKRITQNHEIAQIGFGGCGGMYNYFLGVASVLQEEYDMEGVIFSGSSAGCFPATLLALDVDVKHFFFNENIPLIMEAQEVSYSGLGSWNALVRKNMLNSLHQHAYKKANKRLYFSLTQVPYMRNELVTTWDHNEDMVDCMLSSAFVPIYAKSFVSRFRGKKYLDGSLTNNSPVAFPEHPHKVFQIWKWRWILPNWIPISTNPEWAMEQFRMGREDAMKNLHEIEEVFFS